MKTYWISFVKGHRNAGCCIIDAEDEMDALNKADNLSINPGGEAMFMELPQDWEEYETFGKNTLITREQLIAHQYKNIGSLGPEQQEQFANSKGVSIVCEGCNTKKP